ncbi:MAG: hypothetical protein MI794_06000 [Pseudomonadales bacterium]|nr:hypothetical protein [Pseudomonadales bacterium]
MNSYCHVSAQIAQCAEALDATDARLRAIDQLEQECREALQGMKAWSYPYTASTFRVGTRSVTGSDVLEAMIDLDEQGLIEAISNLNKAPELASRKLDRLYRRGIEQVLGSLDFDQILALNSQTVSVL